MSESDYHTRNQGKKPPSSNRGVDFKKTALNVDWMTCSFPIKDYASGGDIHRALCLILDMRNEIVKLEKPSKSFTSAVKLLIGRLDLQDKGEDSFATFQFTGQDMQAYRAQGGQVDMLLKRLAIHNGKPSRIDLSIDVFDDPRANIADLEQDYRQGNIKTRAKASKLIEDIETGAKTLYIGSRQSQVFFRGYNKAIESGNLGELWTRLELEIKGKSASRLSNQICNVGLEGSARWWFEKFTFTADWYMEMLTKMELSKPDKLNRKKSKVKAWLQGQVLPALRKLPVTEPQTLQWFLSTINQEFGGASKRASQGRIKIRKLI